MDVFVPKENNNDTLVMVSKLYVVDGDYIEKLIWFPVLFQKFKNWKNGKVNSELVRLTR